MLLGYYPATDAPEEYWLIRAARYLKVPPWELAEQTTFWRDWALAAEQAELAAERESAKK